MCVGHKVMGPTAMCIGHKVMGSQLCVLVIRWWVHNYVC